MAVTGEERRIVRFGVFEVDLVAAELRKNGLRLKLQDHPYRALALLLERPGEIVSRDELREKLWPSDTFVEFDHGLNTAINKIRGVLGDSADNPRFVETVPRRGYRFIYPLAGPATPPAPRVDPLPARKSRTGRYAYWGASALVVLIVGAVFLRTNPGGDGSRPAATVEAAPVPRLVTSYPGKESWPSFSPDGNQLVFEQDGQIHVQFVGASDRLRLSDGCCPAWSPDGRLIALLSGTNKTGVLLISPLAGPHRKLAEFEVSDSVTGPPAWHPAGQWLVVAGIDTAGESTALFAVSLESAEKRRLTSPPAGSGDTAPAISPDGNALVFSRISGGSNLDLYLLELSEGLQPKGEPRRIPLEHTLNDQPAWTPDARAIVFLSGTWENPALYEMALAAPAWSPGEPRRLAFAGPGVQTPTISRQGHLAYSLAAEAVKIWRLELNAGRPTSEPPTRLIASTQMDHDPEYSPDGRRIAFASTRSGSPEIWVCNSDGSGIMPLTATAGSLFADIPHWSPDGRLILYTSNPAGRGDTYVISADGVGKPKLLFANSIVDSWSRDGKWIYFHRPAQNGVWKRPWPPSGQDEKAVMVTGGGPGLPNPTTWDHLAFESPDGRFLYYLRSDSALWKVPLGGGEETRVLESNCCWDFAVVDEGIYFRSGSLGSRRTSLEYLSFATGKQETIATLSGGVWSGLSVSPDGRWLLYAQQEPGQGDLWMVENFR